MWLAYVWSLDVRPNSIWSKAILQHYIGLSSHVCGKDREGRFAVIRIPRRKAVRKFLDRVKQWLKAHGHWRPHGQQGYLSRMLRGFYQYFGLCHCTPSWTMCESKFRRCGCDPYGDGASGANCRGISLAVGRGSCYLIPRRFTG